MKQCDFSVPGRTTPGWMDVQGEGGGHHLFVDNVSDFHVHHNMCSRDNMITDTVESLWLGTSI